LKAGGMLVQVLVGRWLARHFGRREVMVGIFCHVATGAVALAAAHALLGLSGPA
jgi:hypothetical protein